MLNLLCDESFFCPTLTSNPRLATEHEPSLTHESMDINVVYLSSLNYSLVCDDEMTRMDFSSKAATFQKPRESDNHLKPLYIRGHLNGSPMCRMLVDGGAIINLMPYSLFKK